MPDLAPKLLPLLRAHHLWFHAYAAFDGWFDEAAELLVPVEGIGITDPAKLEPAVFAVLSKLPKTAALAADALAKAALDRVVTAEAEVVAAVKALDDGDIAVDDFLVTRSVVVPVIEAPEWARDGAAMREGQEISG